MGAGLSIIVSHFRSRMTGQPGGARLSGRAIPPAQWRFGFASAPAPATAPLSGFAPDGRSSPVPPRLRVGN